MTKDVYTVKDIAEQLQVKEKAVRHLISTGKLKANKVCSKWIVTAENFKKLIEGAESSEGAEAGEDKR